MSNELQTKQIIDTVEQKLIGELLNNSFVLEDAVLKLEPRDFGNSNMAAVFGAIVALYNDAKTIDEHTVIDYLTSHTNMQFDDYVVIVRSLASQFGTAADVEDHIDLIKNASIKRRMDQFAGELVTTPINFTDFNDQIYDLEKRFLDITNAKRSSKISTIAQVAQNYQKKLDTIYGKTNEITGTTSGYESIDKITNGFQPGDLIILAARPGVGKTALALNFLLNAAKDILKHKRKDPTNNDVVVMFSLEMGSDQICQRLISVEGQVDMSMSHKGDWGDFQ
jgi:replicative DNA helicase